MTALEEAFRDLAAVLDELELPFAVGGSFASSAFGVPRSTLGVDLVVELSPKEAYHLARLAAPWFAGDPEEARRAVYKFDVFPTTFFAHGEDEVCRRILVRGTALSADRAVPMVSPEDIVLAKLAWYRAGGESSERQWMDLEGIWRMQGAGLDRAYLEAWAEQMATRDLLRRLIH